MTTIDFLKQKFPEENDNFITNIPYKLFPLRIAKKLLIIDFTTDLQNLTYSETGLYLYGKSGVGKTIFSCFYLLGLLKTQSDLNKMFFINTTDLLFKFKASYIHRSDETETELIEKYSKAKLLILDDFGIDKITDWSFQMLYVLINNRYENMLPTIFTSNHDLDEMTAKLGDNRITSRIQESCEIVKMDGKNYRG
jgi:DNA replication protein DnaC